MSYPADQLDELRNFGSEVLAAVEAGHRYLLVRSASLPASCVPSTVDLLLCPDARDGYQSRLFFSEKPSETIGRNWSGPVRILDRNWWVFSWQIPNGCGLRLAQMMSTHLGALR